MGVIAAVVAGSEERTESNLNPRENGGETPYLSQELTDTIDPFLTQFKMDQVRLTDRDLQLILGLMIVISNLLGD